MHMAAQQKTPVIVHDGCGECHCGHRSVDVRGYIPEAHLKIPVKSLYDCPVPVDDALRLSCGTGGIKDEFLRVFRKVSPGQGSGIFFLRKFPEEAFVNDHLNIRIFCYVPYPVFGIIGDQWNHDCADPENRQLCGNVFHSPVHVDSDTLPPADPQMKQLRRCPGAEHIQLFVGHRPFPVLVCDRRAGSVFLHNLRQQ